VVVARSAVAADECRGTVITAALIVAIAAVLSSSPVGPVAVMA